VCSVPRDDGRWCGARLRGRLSPRDGAVSVVCWLLDVRHVASYMCTGAHRGPLWMRPAPLTARRSGGAPVHRCRRPRTCSCLPYVKPEQTSGWSVGVHPPARRGAHPAAVLLLTRTAVSPRRRPFGRRAGPPAVTAHRRRACRTGGGSRPDTAAWSALRQPRWGERCVHALRKRNATKSACRSKGPVHAPRACPRRPSSPRPAPSPAHAWMTAVVMRPGHAPARAAWCAVLRCAL
jgi:hypothetical protein